MNLNLEIPATLQEFSLAESCDASCKGLKEGLKLPKTAGHSLFVFPQSFLSFHLSLESVATSTDEENVFNDKAVREIEKKIQRVNFHRFELLLSQKCTFQHEIFSVKASSLQAYFFPTKCLTPHFTFAFLSVLT
jgi:hypothetical protein